MTIMLLQQWLQSSHTCLYQTASNNHVWFTDKLEYANNTYICQSIARSAGWCDRQSTDVYLYKTAFPESRVIFFQARDWRMNVGTSLQPCSVAVELKTICNASMLCSGGSKVTQQFELRFKWIKTWKGEVISSMLCSRLLGQWIDEVCSAEWDAL